METQGQGGVKYLIWGVVGLIAVLITLKQLGLTPTKVTTGPVSVELSNMAPQAPKPGETPPAQNTSQLESRVRELEGQLHSGASQAPIPSNVAPVQNVPQQSQIPNVAGNWSAGPMTVAISQNGASVVARTFVYGVLGSVGSGALNGNNLRVAYTNNLMASGSFEAMVSPDGTQMNVTDYGKGIPQSFILRRVQ